jgi:hypothetical protein
MRYFSVRDSAVSRLKRPLRLLDYQLFSQGEYAMRSYASLFQVFAVLSAAFFIGFAWAVWGGNTTELNTLALFAVVFVFISNTAIFYVLANIKNRAITDADDMDDRISDVWREFDQVRRDMAALHTQRNSCGNSMKD